MNPENHQKLKAAFIAGRLDASLAMDRRRLPSQDRRDVELLLGMALGEADLQELATLCHVLFRKDEAAGQLPDLIEGAVGMASRADLVQSAGWRAPTNGNGGDRR